MLFGNLPDFLKIIILVFLVLTTNFQRVQYSKSASRLRCTYKGTCWSVVRKGSWSRLKRWTNNKGYQAWLGKCVLAMLVYIVQTDRRHLYSNWAKIECSSLLINGNKWFNVCIYFTDWVNVELFSHLKYLKVFDAKLTAIL